MANRNGINDVAFYAAVHAVMESKGAAAPALEQRREERPAYSVVQKIAPIRGSNPPCPEDFFPVRCYDLTRAGFSFLLPRRPDFRRLAVVLGRAPALVVMEASVRHCTPVSVDAGKEPGPVLIDGDKRSAMPASGGRASMVQVGCRFERRLRDVPVPPM